MDTEDCEGLLVDLGVGYIDPDTELFVYGPKPYDRNDYDEDIIEEMRREYGAEHFSDDELASPIFCMQQRGWTYEEALWRYLENEHVEYRHRNDYSCGGYPKDWEWRKLCVWDRECDRNGGWALCQQCGEELPYRFGAVHHEPPISEGGNHELSHLYLLCFDCHNKRHGGRLPRR